MAWDALDWSYFQAAYQDVPAYAARVRPLLDAEENAAARAGMIRPSALIRRLFGGEVGRAD